MGILKKKKMKTPSLLNKTIKQLVLPLGTAAEKITFYGTAGWKEPNIIYARRDFCVTGPKRYGTLFGIFPKQLNARFPTEKKTRRFSKFCFRKANDRKPVGSDRRVRYPLCSVPRALTATVPSGKVP